MRVALLAAAPAGADQLVFACDEELETVCRTRPDGARFAVAELSAVIGGTQVCTYNSDC